MEYRKLGRSGLKVSEISLGSWLTYGGSVGTNAARECVLKAYELGINFFDTSDAYYRGEAERVLGEVLHDIPRTSYVLATKVFFPVGSGPNDRGLSRKHIMEECHASLKRLGTDYIDLYQCHRYDPETPLDETLRALDDLVSQGKVLYAGVSEWSAEQLTAASQVAHQYNLHPLISNQPQYNMLWRRIEREVIPVSEREGLGQVVFSPLAQGVLTGKYQPGQPLPAGSRATDPRANHFMPQLLQEQTLQAVENLRPIAHRLNLTLSQLALAWVLQQSNVASAITGATRPEQVVENVGAAGVVLSAEDLDEIETALQGVVQY
ncbi:MAG: aldo/keto reductase family protein [Chloroflexi bacterium]|nr:aldo/keto reductase family protein [Chloroflexota bacterium]OJW02778.1 MAG: voltage-gated potassium channel [Chloroflexi bacterium 54-19]